jgi:hypothetical protein
MKRLIFSGLALLVLCTGISCTSTRSLSISDQKRGLMMMEGDQIHKNKGFYKSKKSKKHRRKTYKASKRKYRR